MTFYCSLSFQITEDAVDMLAYVVFPLLIKPETHAPVAVVVRVVKYTSFLPSVLFFVILTMLLLIYDHCILTGFMHLCYFSVLQHGDLALIVYLLYSPMSTHLPLISNPCIYCIKRTITTCLEY